MEKERSSAAQSTVEDVEGMRYKKAVTTVAIAIARKKDKPLEPVGILTDFEFIPYSFDCRDVLFPDFLPNLADVHIHGTGKYEDIGPPNVV